MNSAMPDDDISAHDTPNAQPFSSRELIRSTEEVDSPLWNGLDVLTVVGIFVLGFILTSLGMGIYIHFRHLGAGGFHDPRLIIPLQLSLYAVILGAMFFIIRIIYGQPFWSAIHWTWAKSRWKILVPSGILLAIITEAAQAKLPTPKNMPIEEFFRTPTGAYIMGFLAVGCAPLVEELFFRGFLYPVLARAAGTRIGVLVTALFFAIIHASQVGWAWSSILLLFIVGFVLTETRARTHSVAASFLMHTAYNATIFTLLFFATGHFHHLDKMGMAIGC